MFIQKKLKVIGLDSVYRALPKHIQIGIIKTILVMFKLNILLNSDFRKWIIDLHLKTYTPSVSLAVSFKVFAYELKKKIKFSVLPLFNT